MHRFVVARGRLFRLTLSPTMLLSSWLKRGARVTVGRRVILPQDRTPDEAAPPSSCWAPSSRDASRLQVERLLTFAELQAGV